MSGGVGELLMRKMGWRTGEGLGRNREGTVEPIIIDFKVDRKGVKQQPVARYCDCLDMLHEENNEAYDNILQFPLL